MRVSYSETLPAHLPFPLYANLDGKGALGHCCLKQMTVIDFLGDEPTGFSLPTLYNVVYFSRATSGTDKAAVDRILAVARRRNPVNAITGLLVFGSGIFCQWLEGPREHVTQLMENIKRDTRHDTVVPLSESEEVRERLFPDWAMELVSSEDILAVLEDALSTAEDDRNVEALRRLVHELSNEEHGGLGRS